MSTDRAWIILAEEDDAAELWIVEHQCDLDGDGKISYTFSHASGIGTSIIVSCSCGEEEDVTDYSKW